MLNVRCTTSCNRTTTMRLHMCQAQAVHKALVPDHRDRGASETETQYLDQRAALFHHKQSKHVLKIRLCVTVHMHKTHALANQNRHITVYHDT